jgi:spermidine/putrescine transport system permease protein
VHPVLHRHPAGQFLEHGPEPRGGRDRPGRDAVLDLPAVTLPLVAPGIVASLLICFTISLDEFIIAFFLSGNAPTLPVYLWGQLRFPARLPMIMALGTILVVLSILLLIVAETFRRRGLRRAGLKDSGGFL